MENVTTTTSLLHSEEEGAPTLGGSSSEADLQSPLERLIAQSTEEQQSADDEQLALRLNNLQQQQQPRTINLWSPIHQIPPTSNTKPSLIILAACVCCLLQTGFVWASFLSQSWLETRLYVNLNLPSIHIETGNSQLLHTTTLGNLLGTLLGANQHLAAIGLVMTSLVLPCLCAVTGAAWIVEDKKNLGEPPNRKPSYFSPRSFMEYSARIAFSIFFIFCILTIGSSPLPIEYNGTSFVVVNQFTGGLAAYALGMMLGLMVLALLRFGQTTELVNHTGDNTTSSWQVRADQLFTGIKYGNACETTDEARSELETPLLQEENAETPTNALAVSTDTLDSPPESGGLSFLKRVVLFELALASTVLWIPALFEPLFRLKYEGIVSDFITDVSLEFKLRDFPIELWERGSSAGTNRFLLLIIESIFVQLVLGLPLLANLAAIGTWVLEPRAGSFSRRLLWILQPFLGTFVFGVALYASIPAFETVTKGAVHKFGDGICSKFETVVGDSCFGIQAEASVGLWFVLAQALALELFVVTTLAWHN